MFIQSLLLDTWWILSEHLLACVEFWFKSKADEKAGCLGEMVRSVLKVTVWAVFSWNEKRMRVILADGWRTVLRKILRLCQTQGGEFGNALASLPGARRGVMMRGSHSGDEGRLP